MLYYTGYRKFVENTRLTRLVWRWKSVHQGEMTYVRWYRAAVTDGWKRRLLRRKLHRAEDTALYGARVCARFHRSKTNERIHTAAD